MSESVNTVPFDPVAESQIKHWVSDEVRIRGVQEGWADPQNPREVDWSDPERQSVRGPLKFDAKGYALCPDRTPLDLSRPDDPDQMGGQGELGKQGVNKAGDLVTVAIDENGEKHILLLLRKLNKEASPDLSEEEKAERKKWAVPGGMRNKGEKFGAVAARETLEETHVDVRQEPDKFLMEDIIKDPRNTRTSWVESRASMVIIRHTPVPKADPEEASAVRWFKLTTLEALEKETTDGLYASHGSIVEAAIEVLNRYEECMRTAQGLHGAGEFRLAAKKYMDAQRILPDHFSRGRAFRGLAASVDRIPERHHEAEIHAKVALKLHEGMFAQPGSEERPDLLRERAESRAVLGRVMLGQTVQAEHQSGESGIGKGNEALEHLRAAHKDIMKAESLTGVTDQHKINLLSRLGIAESLYGDLYRGTEYAKEAIALAPYSEAEHVPDPNDPTKMVPNPYRANLGEAHAKGAQRRAKVRGYAALVVNRLVRNPIVSVRPAARRVAMSKAGL